MASQVEIRLRQLERRVEQLAALLLNSTPAELDANWPDYAVQIERGERPKPPKPDPEPPVDPPPDDSGPVDPGGKAPKGAP